MERDEQTEFINWVKHILLQRIPTESDRSKILAKIERGEEITVQYGWDRAFENERLEGKKEGKKESKIEIAENLLKMGLAAEQVVQGTGLSEKEVLKIKTKLKL